MIWQDKALSLDKATRIGVGRDGDVDVVEFVCLVCHVCLVWIG